MAFGVSEGHYVRVGHLISAAFAVMHILVADVSS